MTNYEIRQARIKIGLTQLQFAKKCGIYVRTLQNWESGAFRPDKLQTMGLLQIFEELNHE